MPTHIQKELLSDAERFQRKRINARKSNVADGAMRKKTLKVGPSFSGKTYGGRSKKHVTDNDSFITTRSPEQNEGLHTTDEVLVIDEDEGGIVVFIDMLDSNKNQLIHFLQDEVIKMFIIYLNLIFLTQKKN